MFWKMSSIGWVIRLINRTLLNAPSQNEQSVFRQQKNSTLDWVKRQIIYVWDWSVRSDPIISWDVNYTVLSLHVKRQIIEEVKDVPHFIYAFSLGVSHPPSHVHVSSFSLLFDYDVFIVIVILYYTDMCKKSWQRHSSRAFWKNI